MTNVIVFDEIKLYIYRVINQKKMTKKTKFRISKIFAIASLIFWQVETWYFIIRDGWHWKSITESEKICDSVASILLTISVIFFFSILYDIVELFAYANMSSISITDKNNSNSVS